MRLDALQFDERGLVPAIAQDAETGEIRMMAYANREAVEQTLATGEAHFFSRSRQSLWRKGATSGHTMAVREVWMDCDGDTLLYLVDPNGPSCHTGEETCFFRTVGPEAQKEETGAAPTLLRLERLLRARRDSTSERSYTKSLLDAGAAKVRAKLEEEASELGVALETESDERVTSESGDLLYHLMVGLALRDLSLRGLLSELSRRFGRSGHDEKASRPATK